MLASAQTANTTLYADDFGGVPQVWPDFAVTGLTATGTKLYIWTD
jgi:hypothetical protein